MKKHLGYYDWNPDSGDFWPLPGLPTVGERSSLMKDNRRIMKNIGKDFVIVSSFRGIDYNPKNGKKPEVFETKVWQRGRYFYKMHTSFEDVKKYHLATFSELRAGVSVYENQNG